MGSARTRVATVRAEPRDGRRGRFTGPLWARLCAVVGAVLMMASGGVLITGEVLLARYEGAVQTADLFGDEDKINYGADITGPLNILLVGIDPRPSRPDEKPRADSVIILHVNSTLDRGYLFSLPRDLLVEIPPFEKAGFYGQVDKLTHAMYHGAEVPGGDKPNTVQGFELLAQTVTNYTGIERFDAGAIINFTGFRDIVDAMGGVEMKIDQQVVSKHRQPDGKHRPLVPGGGDYYGPQMVYEPGTMHMTGWQALDFVRQRDIEGGDYARQRHQQQFLKAMMKQALGKDVVTNPVKLDQVLRAAGDALVFSGRGHGVVDFAFALRDLRPSSLVMVKLPGGGVGEGDAYQGEQLEPIAGQFFAALRGGQIDEFMVANPDLVNRG